MKNTVKLGVVLVLIGLLQGCFLTKIATTPMRVTGAVISTVGSVVSIVPVVGNIVDETLEKVDASIDTAADTLDKTPL